MCTAEFTAGSPGACRRWAWIASSVSSVTKFAFQ
jgi:hypothetical protein